MLKKCPTDQLLDCFHTEADNDFPINEYYEVIRVMGNNQIFCICPGRNKSIPDTIGPLRSWVGDPLYQKCVEYVGHYVWDLAQKKRKNKFVFKMKSEGFTFYEMKFWSDIFQYMSFKFLKNNSTEKTDVGLHFAQIWAAAPHSSNLRYAKEIHKTYDLFPNMAIYCTNNFEVLTASEYIYNTEEEQQSITDLNSVPTIKPYKFLFYNNHPKLNRTYNVGSIIKKNLHSYGLMSINMGHDLPTDQAREDRFENIVDQYRNSDNPITNTYYPKTGIDVFQALVNHKELVQSLKPLGKPRWITDDSAKYDSYMALGEDTKEHCAKCYFAIITETKFFHDRVESTPEYSYPVTHDTLYLDCITFTEKTHKFHLAKMPFILYAMPGSLKVLREQGYKTFSPYINETYDLIENDEDRSIAIANEIERLCFMSDEWWYEALTELQPRLDHNFNHLTDGKIEASLRFQL